jgi:hypothetical protein
VFGEGKSFKNPLKTLNLIVNKSQILGKITILKFASQKVAKNKVFIA